MPIDTVHATPAVTHRTRPRRSVVLVCGLALAGTSTVVASPAYAYTNPSPVNLGAAGDYAILARSGISTTGVSAITGDMGVFPSAATAITGFSLTLDPSGTFSTSPSVVGKAYAANYTTP
ncbi:MAG: ice-binding family protein, partial [Streptosporangiaceae bacterium]